MDKTMDILQWSKLFDVNAKPWLLLGKGPTFAKIINVDTRLYHTFALNHVVRELPVTVSHIIDIDVIDDCKDLIEQNAKYVFMPFHPHVKCRPTTKTIHEFVAQMPVLQRLAQNGRLIWYNLSTSKPEGDSPVIEVKFFSAEAALNVLAAVSAQTVRSLGIDGGAAYSAKFQDLRGKTLLANGHESFNKQFAGIARTIRRTGIFYAPLHLHAPVRVFVGTDSAQMAGVKVLEYSIKKFASMSVDVIPIDNTGIPEPQDPANRSRTGFSFCRFDIPRLCGFKGKAIYMDADMQVFTDVSNLWNTPFDGADVLYAEQPSGKERIPQYSVLLLNCQSLRWDANEIVSGLNEGKYNYSELVHRLCIVPDDKKLASLPCEWNSLECYEPGRTRLIHYTDMPTQPWVSKRNRNARLWYDCLREAIQENFISKDFLYREIEEGHVSPELPRWVGLKDPPDFENRKANWVPPCRRFSKPAQPGADRLIKKASAVTNQGQAKLPRNDETGGIPRVSLVKRVFTKIRAFMS